MKRQQLLFLASAFCVLVFFPVPASACGCIPSIEALTGGSPKKLVLAEKRRSTAVFSGKVLSINSSRNAYLAVRFKVERTWKHADSVEITVFTTASDSECGYSFEVGQTYLVYASAPIAGELWTNHCTRTGRIAIDVAEDLRILGRGRAPKWASVKR